VDETPTSSTEDWVTSVLVAGQANNNAYVRDSENEEMVRLGCHQMTMAFPTAADSSASLALALAHLDSTNQEENQDQILQVGLVKRLRAFRQGG
jgi:hypothetical protein